MPKKKPARKKSVNKSTRRKKTIQRKKPTRLTQAAVKIGTALGRADKAAHEAGAVAKKEVAAISKQVKKQLQKTTKRLKSALS
jgi:hypothetical protein